MENIVYKAKRFAYKAHEGMKRKGKDVPYTTHLDKAYEIGKTLTNDEEVLAAIWLHDTVEDTSVTLDEIKEEFGEEVYRLTKLETEDKMTHIDSSLSWKERKTKQINELKNHISDKVLFITFSDKLANLSEINKDLEQAQDKNFVWERFNNHNPHDHFWYYKTFLDIFQLDNNFSKESIELYNQELLKLKDLIND